MRAAREGAYLQIDFVKRTLGVEAQIGNCPLMAYKACCENDHFHNLDHVDCGVEIVPVQALAGQISMCALYIEQLVWDLEQRGVADIDIPVLILGIDRG